MAPLLTLLAGEAFAGSSVMGTDQKPSSFAFGTSSIESTQARPFDQPLGMYFILKISDTQKLTTIQRYYCPQPHWTTCSREVVAFTSTR
jgi:hypothetical protein